MGYCADQHDYKFSFKKGEEESARKAVLAANLNMGFTEGDTLETMLSDLGWDCNLDDEGVSDEMYRSGSKILSSTDDFFKAIAPFVEDGSYIVMIGEDLCIWRWYFHDGELDIQGGEITFPEAMKTDDDGCPDGCGIEHAPGCDGYCDHVDHKNMCLAQLKTLEEEK